MLTIREMRQMSFDNAFRKGKEYYQNGFVKKLEIQWGVPGSGEETEVEGEVRGSGRKSYRAKLTVSPEDEINGYSCECPAYENYWGMCKHCVALSLAFQAEQKKRRSAERLGTPGFRRGTSDEMGELLRQYAVRGRMNRLGGPDHEIDIECYFQTDWSGLLLDLKLGGKRKYVVKNLVKLVRDVQGVRNVQYGSNLEFMHDRSAFTGEAQTILSLLEQAVEGTYPDYRTSEYYDLSSNYRYLLLRGQALESFLNYFAGRDIRLDEQDIPVRDQDPPVRITLKQVPGGAEVETEDLRVWHGITRSFVKKDGAIWRLSPEFADQVLPVLQSLQRAGGRGYRKQVVFLSEADFGSFSTNLLPVLEPFVQIDSGRLDLAAYAPPEPEFSVYLAMPSQDVIEAAARVRYDAKEYDLAAEEPLQAGRNMERELEVRTLLQKYFRPETEKEKAEVPRRRKSLAFFLDNLPVRDLDEDDGRGEEWDRFGAGDDGEGLPVRNLDQDLLEEEESRLPAGLKRLAAVGEEAIYKLLEEGLEELSGAAEMFVDESIRKLSVKPAPRVSMGIGIAGDLIDLQIRVDGMDADEISDILGAYRRRKKFFRLKSGDFIRMSEGGLAELSELSEGLNLSGEELLAGDVKLPLHRALYLEGVLRDAEGTAAKRTPEYRSLIRSMRSYTDSDFEVPAGLRTELRRYQKEGFRWLCTLSANHFGGILADDMGLGKTLQILTLLLWRREHCSEKEKKASLVVAPASLVYNWESEAQRFAPALSVQVIAGTAAERQAQIACAGAFDLNITSYDLLKRDVDAYEKTVFDCCVADEAQYMKNAGTQAAKAVKQVRADHRFAMTGTPIENRLSDLWSIFDFLMPGYLFSYRKFREELEAPIVKSGDEAVSRRLQRLAAPFILRRRKQDVLKDLPDKLEETVTVRMMPEQERIYMASVERLRQELLRKNEKEVRESRMQILAELTRLRQLCCSPELLFENYTGGSGKTDACLDLMKNAVEGGHRVLVFSQFTSMLEILARRWEEEGGRSLYLSGKDSKLARKQMVEEFQRGDVPVFFISLKAGGTGLNLTAADVVIHVDPWWNVAAQNQATDRAHRIGQRHVVSVMKLVAKNSIEEKILKLQEKKAALADSVVEGEGVGDFTLNREDLLALF